MSGGEVLVRLIEDGEIGGPVMVTGRAGRWRRRKIGVWIAPSPDCKEFW